MLLAMLSSGHPVTVWLMPRYRVDVSKRQNVSRCDCSVFSFTVVKKLEVGNWEEQRERGLAEREDMVETVSPGSD